jgi:hypothetical protein
MHPKRPKTLQNIQSPALSQLFIAATRRGDEETRVLAKLPALFRDKCRYGGFSEGELTLIVPSSALATQVRYQQYEILQALRQDEQFRNAWRIRARVAPPHFPRRSEPVKRSLSNKNARLLEEEAGHTKDEGLREILLKLARHQCR